MKVILNYDNVPGLEEKYRGCLIQPFIQSPSRDPYLMADTVYMVRKPNLTSEQMCSLARKAAPLAETVIVENLPLDHSHDGKKGVFNCLRKSCHAYC